MQHIENLDALKKVEELDLSDNKIEKMRNLSGLRYLSTLNLRSNLIGSIEGVDLLVRLRVLDLSGNLVERIPALAKHLGALTTLKLQNNKLSTLRDVVHLKTLANLTDLDVTANPMMEGPHARLFIVFHLSCLNELDGQLITEEEREESRTRFAADELQHVEFELHAAQLQASLLREQVKTHEQRIESLEQQLAASGAQSILLRDENAVAHQELAATTAMLDKKTAEVSSLSELLYELKQEVAFHNIDSQFGLPSPSRRGSFGRPLESPYLGMGSARLRHSIETPEKTMASLLQQLDAVANEADDVEQKEKEKEVVEEDDPVDDSAQDPPLDTAAWIEDQKPTDVSEALAKLDKEIEDLQTQFYAAVSEGNTDDAAALTEHVEERRGQRALLAAEMKRFEEWNSEEETKKRAELETSISLLRAELHAKEQALLQSQLRLHMEVASAGSETHPKAERRLSLEQLVKRDLPTDSAGGRDASASPQLREFLALVEQDHISRIVALIGEVQSQHHLDNLPDQSVPRSLEEAIQLLRKYLVSQGGAVSSDGGSAREQGQPHPHDLAIGFSPADSSLPSAVRERLGQLEAQVSMLEDAKLETFFSEGEDWEQLATAMKALQQQTRVLNTTIPNRPVEDDAGDVEPSVLEEAQSLRDQTAQLQQNLAGKMAALKQMWLAGKISADPEVEKSAAWRYWTQMSQFQFFYFHLKMQLASMNQMLQLRQRQLLDVQNRLIDAKFEQSSGIDAARLVPVGALPELMLTPIRDARKPVVTSLPATPAAAEQESAPVTASSPVLKVSSSSSTSASSAPEPAPVSSPPSPPPELAATVAVFEESVSVAKRPLVAPTVFAPEEQQTAPPPPLQTAVVPAQQQPDIRASVPNAVAKKSPFVSRAATPTPEIETKASDLTQNDFAAQKQPSIPILKVSPSTESIQKPVGKLAETPVEKSPVSGPLTAPEQHEPAEIVDSLPTVPRAVKLPTSSAVASPTPVPSHPAVQNLMEKLEKAAEGNRTAPTAASPLVKKDDLPSKSTQHVVVSHPVSLSASPAPASSAASTLVKKSPFLLADKQRQPATGTSTPTSSPQRPTLVRALTIAGPATPTPAPSPAKAHKRAPSETIAEPSSPRYSPDASPTKGTLSRAASSSLMLKPASATVPGIFSLSGMSSPSGERSESDAEDRGGSPPLSESSGASSGRASPAPPFEDEIVLPGLRKSRPGSGIIDWSKIDNNLKPVASARKTDNITHQPQPVQKMDSVRALLSRSNSVAKPEEAQK